MKLTEITSKLTNLNILYVEDDMNVRDNISELLFNFSKNISTTTNGQEALDMFNNLKIDLVITDISMPVMDGVELVSTIRKQNKKVPIIVLTSYTTTDYLLKFANLNIQSYIVKPINYKKLTDALYNILDYIEEEQNYITELSPNFYFDSKNSLFSFESGESIVLNKKENSLLTLLIKHKNNLVSYEEIEHTIWYENGDSMSSTALRTIIKNLRKKMPVDIIDNVSRSGYKIVI